MSKHRARRSGRARSDPPGVHRRSLGQDQHGPCLRPRATRRAPAHGPAARPLEDLDLRRRVHRARHDRSLRARSPDQPCRLRDLCREGAGPRAPLWRYRRHGQPVQPQGAGGAPKDRGRRRRNPLPAALLARPQPHRNGLRQTQGAAPPGRRTHRRGAVGRHRPNPRNLPTTGMQKLLRRRRIRSRFIGYRSSAKAADPAGIVDMGDSDHQARALCLLRPFSRRGSWRSALPSPTGPLATMRPMASSRAARPAPFPVPDGSYRYSGSGI